MRPVELMRARAEAPAWALELEPAEGLGLPCTPKKVAGRHWPGPSGKLDPKTRAAAAATANALVIFFLLSEPPTAEIDAFNPAGAHTLQAERLRCAQARQRHSPARTRVGLVSLPQRDGYVRVEPRSGVAVVLAGDTDDVRVLVSRGDFS